VERVTVKVSQRVLALQATLLTALIFDYYTLPGGLWRWNLKTALLNHAKHSTDVQLSFKEFDVC
jgi:hypothetical protein